MINDVMDSLNNIDFKKLASQQKSYP
ncbi:hypothetical protein IFVP69_C220001 [Vibrio parahaemolyticus]